MIKDGRDLKDARLRLGWSAGQMVQALRLDTGETDADFERARSRYRAMESGSRHVTGPISVAVEAFLTGFRPEGFNENMG